MGGFAGADANAGSAGATLAPPARRRDPLVLDLDGDGLKVTTLADSQAMFDLSGDQFATRTAWLKGDDGFLVLDGNGDGIVNGIAELFGSATEGGFAELSTWDANVDGKIDAGDAIFATLKVWQDLNGDGVSQAEELQSLVDLGIQSIGLTTAALANPVTDAQLITEGTFTRADGTTGQVGEVLFATNATFSNYIGAVDITEEIAALPDLKGYGKMADLRIAMALDPALQETVTQAVANLNSQDFIAAFERVLYQWAGADDITLSEIDPNALLTASNGAVTFARAGVTLSVQQLGVIKAYSGLDVMRIGDGQWTADGVTQTTGALYRQAWDGLYRNLLAKFAVATGYLDGMLPGLGYDPATDLIGVGLYTKAKAMQVHGSIIFTLFDTNSSAGIDKGLVAELTLMVIDPYTKQTFKSLFGNFISEGLASELAHLYDNPLFKMLDVATTGTAAADTMNGTTGDDILISLAGNDTLHGNAGNDVVDAGDGGDQIYGDDGNDTLLGQAGVDTLYGGNGDDSLDGGEGDDKLYGGSGNDLLLGGEGNDKLYGESGVDVLDGGLGNDHMNGDTGNDRYLFGIGGGQDTLYDYDTTAGNLDTVEFGAGIAVSDLRLFKSGDHLRIEIQNGTDTLTLKSWFVSRNYTVEQFAFADGTMLTAAQLEALGITVLGTAGADTLEGSTLSSTPDTFYGGDGNDTLTGNGGEDRLYGGGGNDYLNGGSNNDRYFFEVGWGQDIVYDNSSIVGNIDTLIFGTGIAPDDLVFSRSGTDLVINRSGSEDRITVQKYFDTSYTYCRVERMEFADGTVWDVDAINTRPIYGGAGDDTLTGLGSALTLYGMAGNDSLTGSAGVDLLVGGDGNDTLTGNAGEDRLYGGGGNDYLNGGSNNDRYFFEVGWGQDIVYDNSSIVGNVDTAEFQTNPLDLMFSRSGEDLKIDLAGTTDSLTVQNWYLSGNYQTEILQSADGQQLLNSQVNQLIQAMATFGAESGLSWAQAVQDRPDDVQALLAAYWKPAA